MREARVGAMINETNGAIICGRARFADTLRLRLLGLLGSDGLEADAGLLLAPSSGVHTFGMRFAIDIVALDKQDHVLAFWQRVGPGKVRALGLRTHKVLELSAGRLSGYSIGIGDRLIFRPLQKHQTA